MKSAARAMLSAVVAAIVQLCAFELLRIVFYGTGWLFTRPTASAWFFAVGGCVPCYLPALLTGLILGRVKGLFRPSLTVPLGVMVFWAFFLGCGASANVSRAATSPSSGDDNDWATGECMMRRNRRPTTGIPALSDQTARQKASCRLAQPGITILCSEVPATRTLAAAIPPLTLRHNGDCG